MKKIILLITLLFTILFSNETQETIQKQSNDFSKIEKEYISSNTINIGMVPSYYPFSFMEGDKLNGYSYDYINLIKKKSGLDINFNVEDWGIILNKFKTKQLDMIDLISYTKKRESFTSFTKPYFEIPNIFFARKDEFKNYTGLTSLKGKKLGITKGVYYYEEIKNLGLFELVEFPNAEKEMKALALEQVDLIINNLTSGYSYIKEGGYTNIKILDEVDTKIIKKEDLRLGIKKEDKILYSIINKSMQRVSIKEKEKLFNKWFDISVNAKPIQEKLLLTEDEKHYLKEKKQITMCIDPEWMPFEKLDEKGKHIGMTADYFQIFEKSLNIDINILKTKTWKESIKNIKNRHCDILSLAMQTPTRDQYLNFTTPYLRIPMVISTKSEVSFINDIGDIKDKTIGITEGYAFVELLKMKYKNLNIVEVKNIDEGLIKVNKGELFGFIGTLASISHQFQSGLKGDLKIAGKIDVNWELGIAVRNDDLVLFNIFEKVVNSLDRQTHQKILNDWISIKYEKGVDYTLLIQMLGIVCILLLLISYRQYLLKKSNTELKNAVKNKTKDLQKLNDNLAIKINEEVQKNLYIQEKLFKSEKLASMGEMIGNIAHQWRQPLSVISTGATGMIIQSEIESLDKQSLLKNCHKINENAQYLSKTIDDFKNFISGDRKKVVFNLDNDIKIFINLIQCSITSNKLNIILDSKKDINLCGYPNELIQCLINIFNNSKDALEEKNLKNEYIFISTKIKDNQAIINMKDNAGGIPNDIISHIFEPYFTTKHKSKGTGIGLHMTYNLIVNGMNGTIEVRNKTYTHNDEEYTGAVFTISIPLA